MSKTINLEVIEIGEGYVVLEEENGFQFEMTKEMLPDNLREGRFVKIVVSHSEYNPDKITSVPKTSDKYSVPNGRNLSY